MIAFAVDEYGTANWMFDVERMVKALTPVLESARRMIHASKFELKGIRIDDKTAEVMLISLQDQKGIVEKNYSVKTGVDKAMAFPRSREGGADRALHVSHWQGHDAAGAGV